MLRHSTLPRLAPLLAAAGIALAACGSTSAGGGANKRPRAATAARSAAASASSASNASPSSSSTSRSAAGLCPYGASVCISTSPRAQVSGPGSTTDKLLRELRHSNPSLTPMRLACPAATSAYPFQCTLDGTVSHRALRSDVTGWVQVIGIETLTDTYAYEVNYVPVRD